MHQKDRTASKPTSRRRFLSQGALGAVAITGLSGEFASPMARAGTGASPATSPSRKIVVGVMGTSRYATGGDGRGSHLAKTLAKLPNVEVAYVCDVDQRHIAYAREEVGKIVKSGTPPKGVGDFRRILDDKDVDALVVATPDHWHAPAAILGCAAGKHVYVEKPCCHNAHEGEMLVAAAKKLDRHVQHGTQRRTWPAMREAVERLRAGDIGRVIHARCFYYSNRATIGTGKLMPAPAELDWPLWQGPAPRREFKDNYLHYTWHWFWNWGTGELGNNGVHFIDQARWGLGVEYPTRIAFTGGKFRYQDDQETPDMGDVSFEFGDKLLTWEYRSWSAKAPMEPDYDVLFAGEKGFMALRGGSYSIHDLKGKKIADGTGESSDSNHLNNFIQTIRGDAKLHAPIDEGYKSALLCNLGNVSYRVGRVVNFDPNARRITGDNEAAALWQRQYEPGWEPKV
ncbi:MAG TPA: Gfo/Idh/MocA family oxidoreductase [Humisphaera sp.]|nr:Gfo/Idh/MocA family oxidoreductase [Humisphaera sp.]